MKMSGLVLLLIVFITACTPTAPVAQETALPSSSPTSSPTTVHTPKNTQRPPRVTLTRAPTIIRTPITTLTPTSTITSTITPYPTFNVNDIQTQVPFPPAACPPENPDYQFGRHLPWDTYLPIEGNEFIQNNLRLGASLRQIKQEIDDTVEGNRDVLLRDVTADGVPELLIRRVIDVIVIGCEGGKHKTILDYDGKDYYIHFFAIEDINRNGITEIVIQDAVTTGNNTYVDILEWDGVRFNSLIHPHKPFMNGIADVVFRDVDKNGIKDLILTDDGPGHWDTLYTFGPWRGQQVIFKWDGIHYLYSSHELDPPVYRFQALQDADRFFRLGEYDKALRFYQDVIFKEKLDWWTPEKMIFVRDSDFAKWDGKATPVSPPPNEDEYPTLAAYARYRILLHHLSRGWINDAKTVYTTLIEQYPEGSAGYPYAAMATILWTEYQKTSSLDQSCRPVADYAASHPEILAPLGDFSHGAQSHEYVAEDVCPFPLTK